MGLPWTAQDEADFEGRGWTLSEAQAQLNQLVAGGRSVAIVRPCSAGDGIHVLAEVERLRAIEAGVEVLEGSNDVACFVPASGAATRMFAPLRGERSRETDALLEVRVMLFPFWSSCQRDALAALRPEDRVNQAVEWILDGSTGWSHLPKGLIPFHRYADGVSRTSFEEHASEWELLAGEAPLHFTVSKDFQSEIESLFARSHHISTSIQLPETDTLAWDEASGDVARHADGRLLFRPGGHGALLRNLTQLDADFVFIRNIDNVVPAQRMPMRNQEQQVLLGHCASLVKERNALLNSALNGEADWQDRAFHWLRMFDERAFEYLSEEALIGLLNRPIRVAGMVVNEGAPGGGPFWIHQSNGSVVPSIVEGSELPTGGLTGGTHFNPVNLVCHGKDYKGHSYDLDGFTDGSRFFTGFKDWNGKAIRILERPGLWNGGMDGWLTRFVEVPVATFAPVKTLFDLLDDVRLSQG